MSQIAVCAHAFASRAADELDVQRGEVLAVVFKVRVAREYVPLCSRFVRARATDRSA